MPTYDYVCDACQHEFEEFQGINDPLLKKCPKCKKSKLRRLFGTGAALMFKGSGFYITDYRSDGYKKAADADKSSSSSSSSSESKADSSSKSDSSTKSESKPAAESSKKDSKPKKK